MADKTLVTPGQSTATTMLNEASSRLRQNGVTRPRAGTITGRVWEIADEVSKAFGNHDVRKEVIAKGLAAGINAATLQTQISEWRRFQGLGRNPIATGAPGQTDAAAEDEVVERRILKKLSNQIVGNAGLYYGCFKLSLDGWNVIPTSRNARGIDILAYSQTGKRFLTVLGKALSNPVPVPLGKTLPVFIPEHILIFQR